MHVNNFEQLYKFIKHHTFFKDNDFLLGEIIKRRKDNPNIVKDNYVCVHYFIKSIDDLKNKEHDIISICDALNARFYINPNVKNFKNVTMECLGEFQKILVSEKYNTIKKLVTGTSSRSITRQNDIWLVDIDEDMLDKEDEIIQTINSLRPVGDKILDRFETNSGCHLLTRKFDSKSFDDVDDYKTVEVKRNSPTLIYYK